MDRNNKGTEGMGENEMEKERGGGRWKGGP